MKKFLRVLAYIPQWIVLLMSLTVLIGIIVGVFYLFYTVSVLLFWIFTSVCIFVIWTYWGYKYLENHSIEEESV